MPSPATPRAVLLDACLLVKDVVSYALFDLHDAGLIRVYWTPEIESEYIGHRGRLRAEDNARGQTDADLIWASDRIETIKRYLVPGSSPPGWEFEKTLEELVGQSEFAGLSTIKDEDDIHVAIAAAHLRNALGRPVILATENLDDLPQSAMDPFGVVVMHPGALLELLYTADPIGVSASLKKTCADFQNPQIPLSSFLLSIASRNQFFNEDLAERLFKDWGVTFSKTGKGKKGGGKKGATA